MKQIAIYGAGGFAREVAWLAETCGGGGGTGQKYDAKQKAFESNYIAPLGPQVDAFEREFSE